MILRPSAAGYGGWSKPVLTSDIFQKVRVETSPQKLTTRSRHIFRQREGRRFSAAAAVLYAEALARDPAIVLPETAA
jgi:hypothetical protein